MKESELDANTLAAQKEELERKQRLMELKRNLLDLQRAQQFIQPPPQPAEQKPEPQEDSLQNSQLKSLLQGQFLNKQHVLVFLKILHPVQICTSPSWKIHSHTDILISSINSFVSCVLTVIYVKVVDIHLHLCLGYHDSHFDLVYLFHSEILPH